LGFIERGALSALVEMACFIDKVQCSRLNGRVLDFSA